MLRKRLLRAAENGAASDRLVYAIWLVVLMVGWLAFELAREPFITVNDVTVSRSIEGEDPQVSYVTTVHRRQTATWTVDLVGTDCRGEGNHTYLTGSRGQDWRLYEQYLETQCRPSPGAYAMLTCYQWLWGLREHCAPPVVVVVNPND